MRLAKKLSRLLVICGTAASSLPIGGTAAWAVQESPEADGPGSLATRTDLIATPAAPTGARGVVELGPAALFLEIERLSPGLYQLGVVRKSDNTWAPVGLIAVSNPTLGPEQRAGEDRNERNLTYQADVLKIRSQTQLPPDLAVSDISQVVVSDLGGSVLLQTAPAAPAAPPPTR